MKFSYAALVKKAESRPPGYLEEILSLGTRDGDHVILTEENYAIMYQKYNSGAVPPPKIASATQAAPVVSNIPPKYPTITTQAKSAATSVANWATSGFRLTTPEEYQARLEICKGCEFWDAEALSGTGRCKKCGCSTKAKLKMATEKCPIDKWGKIV